MEEKEKSLKILAVQMSSKIGDKDANFKKVEELISKSISDDVDIIVLPEVWAVGWKPSIFEETAEDINNSETIKFLSRIAKKYNTNIIGGSFISRKEKREQETENRNLNSSTSQLLSLYNTCPVIDRKGSLIATYNKMHLFSYYGCMEGSYVKKGQNPTLVSIEGVKIALSICYDIRFPEFYRACAKAGADVLINMAAWPMSRAEHWEALTKARTIENQCFMVALTQSGQIEGDEWNLGHSRIISYDGSVIAQIGVENNKDELIEGAMIAEIKFDKIYEFRKKCTVLLDIQDSYDVLIK